MQLKKREYVHLEIGKPMSPTKQKATSKVEDNKDKSLLDKVRKIDPVRSARQRMLDARNQPEIDQLLSMAWQSQELHVLFADTGVGKSIFAVALALSLCKGESFLGLRNETFSQRVLYYDFELSDRQFWKRYSDENGNEDTLHENLFIDTINFAQLMEATGGLNEAFNDVLFEKMKHDIKTCNATVLIIDNLTYLNTQSTQDTKIALDTMRRLNDLKSELGLSILVLAHTPKRSSYTPITLSDLAGSKHLSNFADSISAIGKSSQASNMRYYKQVKPSRSGEMLYHDENVVVIEIIKRDTMLTFDFLEFGLEKDHIQDSGRSEYYPDNLEEVSRLYMEGKSYGQIAKQLGMSKGTLSKWKEKYPYYFDRENAEAILGVSKERNPKTVETQETLTQNKLEI